MAGQFVTVGAQDVMVYTEVVYTVDVVYLIVGAADMEKYWNPVLLVAVAVTGQTVV